MVHLHRDLPCRKEICIQFGLTSIGFCSSLPFRKCSYRRRQYYAVCKRETGLITVQKNKNGSMIKRWHPVNSALQGINEKTRLDSKSLRYQACQPLATEEQNTWQQQTRHPGEKILHLDKSPGGRHKFRRSCWVRSTVRGGEGGRKSSCIARLSCMNSLGQKYCLPSSKLPKFKLLVMQIQAFSLHRKLE